MAPTPSVNFSAVRCPRNGPAQRNAVRPISADAAGRVRVLLAQLSSEADRIEAAARQVPASLVRDIRKKFGRGADRALDEIIRNIPAQLIHRERRTAAWRFLRPAAEPGQISVQVAALLLNSAGSPGLTVQPFGLVISRHAIGRLLDRTQFRADPVRAILEAHDGLLALTPEEGERLFLLPTFQLPGASGAFLAASCGGGSTLPMTVVRTWIDRNQLDVDQQRHTDAWARLLEPQPRTEPVLRGGGADHVSM